MNTASSVVSWRRVGLTAVVLVTACMQGCIVLPLGHGYRGDGYYDGRYRGDGYRRYYEEPRHRDYRYDRYYYP